MKRLLPYILCSFCLAACTRNDAPVIERPITVDTIPVQQKKDTLSYDHPEAVQINTGNIKPEEVVAFAQTLEGVPYQYASCDPGSGFDCSGFVYYIFDHFGITVPRSSADFSNLGQAIGREQAKPGDLILFTGTDSSRKTVGHIGMVLSNDNDSVRFIHSSSGSAHGVTTSPLNGYYEGRFMKVIRVFPSQPGVQ